MSRSYEAVVIGAGHNGVVCAAYLGRADLKVAVLERRSIHRRSLRHRSDVARLPGIDGLVRDGPAPTAHYRGPGTASVWIRSAALYQCGLATHPGGGVMGVLGHNAAREILRDWEVTRLVALAGP